jgi:competence protein ComEA
MPPSTRLAITILAVIAAIAIAVTAGWGIYRGATRPQVVITVPPGVGPVVSPIDQPAAGSGAASPQSALAAGLGPILVDVAGAVKHPAVYKMAMGQRVADAIKMAGGPVNGADEDAVNLAEPVHDGEKVYLPKQGDVAGDVSAAGSGNEIGHFSASGETEVGGASTKTDSHAVASVAKLTSPSQGQIDINTATVDQLQRLPGVGPAMAQRIIAAREKFGQFRRPEDLRNVSGIGPKKYAKMKSFVKT